MKYPEAQGDSVTLFAMVDQFCRSTLVHWHNSLVVESLECYFYGLFI